MDAYEVKELISAVPELALPPPLRTRCGINPSGVIVAATALDDQSADERGDGRGMRPCRH
jgi:hypothetical protein